MSKEWDGKPNVIPDVEAFRLAQKNCLKKNDPHEVYLHAVTHVILRLSGAEFSLNGQMVRHPKGMKEAKVVTVAAVRDHNRKARAEGMTLAPVPKVAKTKPPRTSRTHEPARV
jgi:hypothetical protein